MEAFGILFGLILLSAVILVVNLAMSEPKKVAFCEGAHKWVTDPTEKLFCEACNYRPGEHQ